MDLSFVIVSWNAKAFLEECLRSVLDESPDRDVEIIVVDNQSTDGSQGMLAEAFPQVRLIQNEENLGFAAANNIGIEAGRSKYVFLVNSDIKILDGCIDTMVDYMEGHPAVGMLGPRVLNGDRTLQKSCRRFPRFGNMLARAVGLDVLFPQLAYCPHDAVRKVDVLSGCFWMVRRAALDDVGLLDETFFMYSEDVDWCKRFHRANWDVVYCPDAEAIHYGGASSSNAPVKFYIEMQRAKLQYWNKHEGRLACGLFYLISLFHQILRMFKESVRFLVRPSGREESRHKLARSRSCAWWLLCLPFVGFGAPGDNRGRGA